MPNRLASETSPYLQQHADNPVDWYPWGEEALELARRQDKPILLSIGYSACHWCHVMAHESFEDRDVAAEMNRHFVNVKVDREERPDLDQIYQTAHHMLTQRAGGWPLTMFLTPEGAPFFAGTYFPKTPRYGMPGFKDLLARISEAYRDKRSEITQQNAALIEALKRTVAAPAGKSVLDLGPVEAAVRESAQLFDDVHGGIGDAPKFPHPYELHFCLRRHALEGGALSEAIVRLTLTRMAEGGIYDQLGGGFCRYSVDRFWTIPHFEKMLYDNGPLLALYSDAWLQTRDPLYQKVVGETAQWVQREMQSADGGYYASLDADSEGVEGKFYVWTREETQTLLTAEEYSAAALHFGLDREPNFEGRHWHLRIAMPLEAVAEKLGISLEACRQRLDSARAKLFSARESRVRPGRDEKVLTSWNALMVKGMARAGRAFGRADWVNSARRSMEFIRSTLWRNGRLLATYKDGHAHLNAYLDDHAFLLDALLELMQADFRPADLELACAVAELLLQWFEDAEHGGFFFVSHDHERLIHRPKSAHDSATPSGNGVAAFALQRLGHIVGEVRYLAAAERTLKLFFDAVKRNPSGHVSLTGALEEALTPPRIVIVRGATDAIVAWKNVLAAQYRPDTLVLAIDADTSELPAALAKPAGGAPAAWVCEGTTCLPPIGDLSELERALSSKLDA
ncbi:MAG: thioredoxin domain-containing protein [Burkholderiales bacterium]